jgi:hypothetical protein
VITIQRVRVRWGPASRGVRHATARRGLNRAVPLPVRPPAGEVVVHDALLDEAAGYARRDDVWAGSPGAGPGTGLWLGPTDAGTVVKRLLPTAAYPRHRGPGGLFTLGPGQVGRYRVNFRFTRTQCPCDMSWYYEDWVVHVANGPVAPGRFVHGEPDFEVDDRVHLYGGSRRPAGAGPARMRRAR